VNYTFAVTATNNIGTGVASASSVVMKPLSPGVSETTFEITITVSVGDPVAGGTAEFASSGLEPGTPWSLIVRSTPRLLSSGAAGAAGTILGNAVIPSGLGEGWHSLTLTGRDYLGRDASSTTWFQVNAAGELVGSSHVDPTVSSGLASTGRDVALPFQAAILLILLGGVLTRLTRKRNSRG
jgi:predicted phage tail protein